MERKLVNPPLLSSFNGVYNVIRSQPDGKSSQLITTGGISFVAEAKIARDGRRFIALPHNNRIYETDWGFMSNGMGKAGQWIGHYSVPLDNWAIGQQV